jgi:H+/gluconate symporter-like permease
MRLKAAGVAAFIIPATEQVGPDCNLILIFTINGSVFAYRPNNGLFELSKDAFTKLESQQVADPNTQ